MATATPSWKGSGDELHLMYTTPIDEILGSGSWNVTGNTELSKPYGDGGYPTEALYSTNTSHTFDSGKRKF